MNKTLIREWVDALRSGDYQQGKGGLLKINADGESQYCCLGVLCEIAGAEKFAEADDRNVAFDNSFAYLPRSVMDAADLTDPNPYIRPLDDTDARPIANFNDDAGYTFGDIALMIETRWL